MRWPEPDSEQTEAPATARMVQEEPPLPAVSDVRLWLALQQLRQCRRQRAEALLARARRALTMREEDYQRQQQQHTQCLAEITAAQQALLAPRTLGQVLNRRLLDDIASERTQLDRRLQQSVATLAETHQALLAAKSHVAQAREGWGLANRNQQRIDEMLRRQRLANAPLS